MATKKISGYRIDFTTGTLIMNYKFYAASQQYGSPEYKLVKSITKDFPNLTVSVQAGREVTTANKNKRMTYKNIAYHPGACQIGDGKCQGQGSQDRQTAGNRRRYSRRVPPPLSRIQK